MNRPRSPSNVRTVILHDLSVDEHEFANRTGWAIKPEGACKAEVCVPLPPEVRARRRPARRHGARRNGSACRSSPTRPHGVWALGPETAVTGKVLTSAVAPELELPDADGNPFKLSSLRGKKVVLVSWASWCGCRFDLPLWQNLRDRWHAHGVEVVTVALDVEASEAQAVHRAGAARTPVADRRSPRLRRAVRFRERAERCVDRRRGHDRAPGRARAPRSQSRQRVVPQGRRGDRSARRRRDARAKRARSRAIPRSTSR